MQNLHLLWCKKYSRSSWALNPHVKSVFYTADIFAVHYNLINKDCRLKINSHNQILCTSRSFTKDFFQISKR